MAAGKTRHTYVIGDVQGCYDELRQLLDIVGFDDSQDKLWLTGDLVSRGPKSLEVLRYIKSLGDAAITVLGNHDLHLLAALSGSESRRLDPSLKAIAKAADRDELLTWLRQRPLIHRETRSHWPHDWLLLHAGLPPQWDADMATRLAGEVEALLRGDEHSAFFANMYGDHPDQWSEKLTGWDRLRFITNCLTRLRYCTASGQLLLAEKGKPSTKPQKSIPWFMVPDRQSRDVGILFGHWSTLGQVVWSTAGVYGLDGGCLWGGSLIALRLEDMALTYLPCTGHKKPG